MRVGSFLARVIRAVRTLAGSDRIPRPLRWAVVFGALPIPGPVDEIVLLRVAALLWMFWRDVLLDAWRADASLSD